MHKRIILEKVSYWPKNQWKGVVIRDSLYPIYKNLPNLMKSKFYEMIWDKNMEVLFRLKMWFPLWTATIIIEMRLEDYWESYDNDFNWLLYGDGYTELINMDSLPTMYSETVHKAPFKFIFDFRMRDD